MLNKKLELLSDGYTIIHNVISNDEINAVRSLYLEKLQYYKESTLPPALFLKEEKISNLIFSDSVVGIINKIVGTNFNLYPDFTIRKSLYIPWHTDTSYLSICDTDSYEESNMIQMSIYLQDNDEQDGGGLEIIPGSHRFRNIDRATLLSNPIDFKSSQVMPSRAGSLVFWDSRLIHRSCPNPNKGEVKLAIQWTISKNDLFSTRYLSYLSDRVLAKKKHVSDELGNRELSYLQSIGQIKYPDSFSEQQLSLIRKNGIKLQLL